MPAFVVSRDSARQLTPAPFANEKELQNFFERNMDELLGVKFVASEFSTGTKYAGRIDSLGLDEVGNPVIVEYKWDRSESVINQGLFYFDWLMDHRGDFAVAVAANKELGPSAKIVWTGPRLIIVAANYTKYDSYAVNQLSTNIELLRYRRYSDGFLVVENVLDPLATTAKLKVVQPAVSKVSEEPQYGLEYHLAKASPELKHVFMELREQILSLQGVEERANQKGQITYRTTKSFAAFDFKKSLIGMQFKGGPKAPQVQGIIVKDIRTRQWGYPWMCNLTSVGEIPAAFEIVKSAYAYEQ